MKIQDITAIIGAGTGVLSFIWSIIQQKELTKIKSQNNLKNSGYIGSNAKSGGGDIAGRDIKK